MVFTCAGDGRSTSLKPDCFEEADKCLSSENELDLLELISNTYLLIVPSKRKSSIENAPLKAEKMITMTSEDFLKAFQSLLGVPGNEGMENIEKCGQEEYITTDAVGDWNDCGQTNTNFSPSTEKDSPDCRGLLKTRTVPVETRTIAGKCGSLSPSDRRMPEDSNRPTEKSVTHACKNLHSEELVDKGEKCSSQTKGNKNLQNEDLKNALLKLSPCVRNLCLEKFTSPGANVPPAITHLHSHLSLLREFVHTSDSSIEINERLMKGYIFHLEKLAHCFVSTAHEDVITLDQNLLSCARRSKCWDFREAWAVTEAKKENYHPGPKKLKANLPRSRSKYVVPKRSTVPDSRGNQVRTDSYNKQRHANSNFSRSRTFSPLLNRNSKEREQQYEFSSPGNREPHISKRLSTSHDYSPAKRKRQVYGEDTSQNECMPKHSYTNLCEPKRMRKNDNKPCRYFNKDTCNKSKETCGFSHVCSVCKSPSHSKLACKQCTLTHIYD